MDRFANGKLKIIDIIDLSYSSKWRNSILISREFPFLAIGIRSYSDHVKPYRLPSNGFA